MIIGAQTIVLYYLISQFKPRRHIIFNMSGVPQHPCTICGKGGHSPSRCKELGIPPEGFYKPAPGQHQHDDDEDESINLYLKQCYNIWLNQLISGPRVRRLF
jgi:hypothetical protein